MDFIGRKFGKYELIERLGQGGMAEVYKAHQPGLDRFVALKVMHRHLAGSPDFITRFKREAKSIGQLQHPHIMHVIDFDVEDDVYYLVMDYIQGDTLADYLRWKGPLPIDEALTIMAQLTDAVDYAHQQGMIHRDIKPANVMFQDKAHTQVILTDFGMARLLDETGLTVTGALVGTPSYMSPEAVRGEPTDERSDIYSLGLALYEMVTGVPPYTGDSALAIIMKQANEPLPPPRNVRPDLPQAVERLIFKALAKEPTERFQSAAAFREAILQAQTLLPGRQTTPVVSTDHIDTVVAAPPPIVSRKAVAKTKPWLLWAVAGGGTLLVVLLVIVSLAFNQPDQSQGVDQAAVPIGSNEAAVGFLRFADNDNVRAGDFILQMDDVSPPPNGSHYTLWLMDDNGQNPLNLIDQLPLNNGQVNIEGSTDQNLLGSYSQVIISLEADNDPDEGMSAEIAYRGALPLTFIEPIRQIIFADPVKSKGFLPGAEEQLHLAMDHAGFANDALAEGDLDTAINHAEHVVNILDGEEGPEYGDLNGDGRIQNPGDGFGARAYLAGALEQITLAAEATTMSADGQLHAEQFRQSDNNHLAFIEEAIKLAAKIAAADTPAEAQNSVDDLTALLDQLLNGTDLDGNGVIDPTKNEGGLLTLYEDSLRLGQIPIFITE